MIYGVPLCVHVCMCICVCDLDDVIVYVFLLAILCALVCWKTSLVRRENKPRNQEESKKLSDLEKRKNLKMANSALASPLSLNHVGMEVHLTNFNSELSFGER